MPPKRNWGKEKTCPLLREQMRKIVVYLYLQEISVAHVEFRAGCWMMFFFSQPVFWVWKLVLARFLKKGWIDILSVLALFGGGGFMTAFHFLFSLPTSGRFSILTKSDQMGWNHVIRKKHIHCCRFNLPKEWSPAMVPGFRMFFLAGDCSRKAWWWRRSISLLESWWKLYIFFDSHQCEAAG